MSGLVPDTVGRSGITTTPATVVAYARLLGELAAAGGSPCHANPERWQANERNPEAAEAVALCETCPVLDACRSYALSAGEPFGVWGALTAADRRKVLGKPDPVWAETEEARVRRIARQRDRRERLREGVSA